MTDPSLIRNGHALAKLVAAIRRVDDELDIVMDRLTRDMICIQIADECLPEHARISFLLACGVKQECIRANQG